MGKQMYRSVPLKLGQCRSELSYTGVIGCVHAVMEEVIKFQRWLLIRS